MNPAAESIDCLIIGCGPVGALAGNLLGQLGVPTLILEKESDVYHLPRAAHFDDEIMRILQSVGLHDRLEGIVRPIDGMDLVDARGRTLLSLRPAEGPTLLGHAQAHLFYQPDLERVLRAGLDRFPCVTFRPRHEVLSISPAADHVSVEVRDLDSGVTRHVQARYVLGCDGARSLTRKAVDARMDDLGLHQPWLVIDLLMRREVRLPERAVQVCDPRRPATLIPFPPPRRRWEFMLMPGDTPEGMVEPDNIRRLLSPWLQPADYDIERAAVYTFHALLARPWRLGRVFLLGDAAHQMPPFLGQGMCAGFRDAFNLCWKIDAALRPEGSDALLASYESERSPHVAQVINLAVRMGRVIQSSNRLIGAIRNTALRLSRFLPARHGMPESVAFIPLGHGFVDTATEPARRGALPFLQPRVTDASGRTRLLDDLLGPGFALVGCGVDPDRILPADLRRRCDLAGLRRLAVASADSDPRNPDTIVSDGTLETWFRSRKCNLALVRPDRFVYGAWRSDGDPAQPNLLKAIDSVLKLAGNQRPQAISIAASALSGGGLQGDAS